jgi:hypothetical protein
MPGSRQNIERRIRQEWSREVEHVAYIYLTKAMGAATDLVEQDRRELRDLLTNELRRNADHPPPAASQTRPAKSSPSPRPRFDESRILQIVATAMQAPTDGSRTRFEVLTARARGTLERELEETVTGWWQRRRIWREFRRQVKALRETMVPRER